MAKNASTDMAMTFDITRSFCKDSMTILPPQNKYRVSKEDNAVSSAVLTLIKQKGLIFDRASTVKSRSVTVTRQGFMIIYYREDRGYVVNLSDALKVKSSTKKSLQVGVKRTCIEVKMAYGAVTLAILGEEADEWIRSILRSVCRTSDTVEIGAELQLPTLKEKVASRETEETVGTEEESTVDEPETMASTLPTPAEKLPTPRSCQSSETTTTTTVETYSVRQGERSVATLRQLLMAKVASKIDSKLKKTSAQLGLKKTSFLKEEQKTVPIKKAVPLATYKSRSAPAVF